MHLCVKMFLLILLSYMFRALQSVTGGCFPELKFSTWWFSWVLLIWHTMASNIIVSKPAVRHTWKTFPEKFSRINITACTDVMTQLKDDSCSLFILFVGEKLHCTLVYCALGCSCFCLSWWMQSYKNTVVIIYWSLFALFLCEVVPVRLWRETEQNECCLAGGAAVFSQVYGDSDTSPERH